MVAIVVAALTMLVGLSMPASAHGKTGHHPGTRSLAALLAKDGSGFDHNWNDFDITDNAVAAVLKAKPNSPVGVLADGTTPLTAFLPTDRAFQRLAESVTGKHIRTEKGVFTAVAGLGIDTVEAVLLYHVVPGATITYKQARHSDDLVLTTALDGATVRVNVLRGHKVSLVDLDTDNRNPRIVRRDLNKGNLQIAHGIDRVLRPVDLP
ncbi:hypothetical protein GCM10022197_29390 [Microlunatus spumicola]|uniref:FAS1 domain-containing protein n=1 Tax=Microlunatus spumicola TaxID=81499 RepID=A0ABP6XSL1_9ACTN